jgi:hypothetical protein
MGRKFPSIFLLFPASLILLFFVSCGPNVFVVDRPLTSTVTFEALATPTLQTHIPVSAVTASPACPWADWPCPSDSLTLTAEMGPTLAAMLTSTPVCSNWPCPSDSLTMTAAMGLTFAAIPSSTSPAWATIIPQVGDLGWGSIYGIISDGVTNLPIEGATVRCEHSSYTSPYPCSGITWTNADGIYAFTSVFFHDTDRITLIVEKPGYNSLRFEETSFTRPEFHADLGLDPITGGPSSTPTPYIVCTPPACSGGVLTCGNPNGCTGGCGTVCLTATPAP